MLCYIIPGLVERCNQMIEDVIKKAMQNQTDWAPMLPSVLFAIRTSKHCSTGFTPFRILYNFDPILQFEYGDKVENSVLSDEEADYQGDMES